MRDGIMITIGDDGESTLYDDTYDITIHCESQEEQDEVKRALQNIPHWHPVSEQPQEDDDYLLLTYEYFKYGTFKRIIIGAWNGATNEWLEEYEGMYRDVNHPVAWMSKEELLLLKGWEVAE